MIPPLNMLTRARGVSPLAVAAAVANRAPMSFEFSVEPESEAKVTAGAVAAHAHEELTKVAALDQRHHSLAGAFDPGHPDEHQLDDAIGHAWRGRQWRQQ